MSYYVRSGVVAQCDRCAWELQNEDGQILYAANVADARDRAEEAGWRDAGGELVCVDCLEYELTDEFTRAMAELSDDQWEQPAND